MTGARITTAFDDRATVARLRRLSTLMVKTTPLMREIGSKLVANTEDRLGAGHAPDGTAWAPLNPGYAAIKKGAGILVASGQLRKSLTFTAAQNNVVIGSNKVYAAIHQFGGVIKAKSSKGLFFYLGGQGPNLPVKGKRQKAGTKVGVHVMSVRIPARPYLGVSSIDQRDVIETVDRFIDRALGRS